MANKLSRASDVTQLQLVVLKLLNIQRLLSTISLI